MHNQLPSRLQWHWCAPQTRQSARGVVHAFVFANHMLSCCLQTEALATAAVRAATKLQAALIVVFTVTGRTARLIAKYRPSQPILTVRHSPKRSWV